MKNLKIKKWEAPIIEKLQPNAPSIPDHEHYHYHPRECDRPFLPNPIFIPIEPNFEDLFTKEEKKAFDKKVKALKKKYNLGE